MAAAADKEDRKMGTIRIKAKEASGVVTVRALMTHPMETGLRKNKKTGEKIPARFINEVVGKSNGKVVITANWSGSIAKNPYLSYRYKGSKGDKIELSWTDNTGKSDSTTATVA